MIKRLLGISTISLMLPLVASAATSFTIKDQVAKTTIGTVSSVTRDCSVDSNDGKTLKVTCRANLFSNEITFPLKNTDGENIGFINISNPLLWMSKVELRDPKNQYALSTSYASGTSTTENINSEVSAGNYLVTQVTADGNVVLIKNINN